MSVLTTDLTPIAEAFCEAGLFRNPRYTTKADFDETCKVIEGEVNVEGQTVTLQLVLTPDFPNYLPLIYLAPYDTLGVIPHVLDTGLVCFLDSEGILLDRTRPIAILEQALNRAILVLSDGITGRNWTDFADEFEVYWGRLTGGLRGVSLLQANDIVREVWIAVQHKPAHFWIADGRGESYKFTGRVHPGARLTQQSALYLPLEPGTVLRPPIPQYQFETMEAIREYILPGLSQQNRERLDALIKKRLRYKDYIIVRLLRPSGGYSLFGFRLQSRTMDSHPLNPNGETRAIVPLQITRQDRDYLVPRGGGIAHLTTKRVVIVGCGAVGGYLALELARAGIGHLTLIDPQPLEADNTHRHALGARYWGYKKVHGLKAEIETNLPYANVTAIDDYIERVLDQNPSTLKDADLVIIALGIPTLELSLNEHFHTRYPNVPLLFTWLEPLGIGGHTLVANQGDKKGCFQCLYTDTDTGPINRAAFAAAGQSFGRALSGCGSLFTPYGSVDVMQTVGLAARQAIRILTGDEHGNPLRSWKGDASTFTAAGYQLSGRYDLTEEEMVRHQYAYQLTNCRVCGSIALVQAA